MDNRQISDELDQYSDDFIRYLIDQFIHSERNRYILKRKILDRITFEKLAEEVGLSVRRTKSIVYEGKWKIYKHVPQ